MTGTRQTLIALLFLVLFLDSPAWSLTAEGTTSDESTEGPQVNQTFSNVSSSGSTSSPLPRATSPDNEYTGPANDTTDPLDWNSTFVTHSIQTVKDSAHVPTTNIPDVTATSQKIYLQTTTLPVGGNGALINITGTSVDQTVNDTRPTEQVANNTSTTNQVANDTQTTERRVNETNTSVQVVSDNKVDRNASYTTNPELTTDSTGPGTAATNKSSETSSGNKTVTSTFPTNVVEHNQSLPVSPNISTTEENSSGPSVETTEGKQKWHSVLLTFNATCNFSLASFANQGNDFLGIGNTTTNTVCESEVKLRMSVLNVSRLNKLVGVAQLRVGPSLLTLANVQMLDVAEGENEDYIPWMFSNVFSSREIITYVVVGSIFGLVILTVSILLCCKCCVKERRRKKSRDIPHLTMRLEDYSLTRIPRPSTLFGGVRNGMATTEGARIHQAFETSVVPFDEDQGSLTRGHLRSFSGRKFRHRVTETDDDVQSRSGSVRAGSTERLARDFENQRTKRGAENQNFRF